MTQTEIKNDVSEVVQNAIAEVGEIATLPEVTVKIIEIVENPRSTARDLHDVIKGDPALTSRILKVVNSAFYGLPGQISDIDRAIVLLGLSAVKNIAIAASMTNLFSGGPPINGFSGVEVWRHSLSVGVASRLVATAMKWPKIEECFLAGLISDLGLLVERQVFGQKLPEVIQRLGGQPGSMCELEQEIIGADHQAFGMALAKKWRFPQALCTTIGYHHKPMELASVNRELPILVHIADILACRVGIGFCTYAADQEIASEVMEAIKLDEQTLAECLDQFPEHFSTAESIFS